jgi:hypothetical protein
VSLFTSPDISNDRRILLREGRLGKIGKRAEVRQASANYAAAVTGEAVVKGGSGAGTDILIASVEGSFGEILIGVDGSAGAAGRARSNLFMLRATTPAGCNLSSLSRLSGGEEWGTAVGT